MPIHWRILLLMTDTHWWLHYSILCVYCYCCVVFNWHLLLLCNPEENWYSMRTRERGYCDVIVWYYWPIVDIIIMWYSMLFGRIPYLFIVIPMIPVLIQCDWNCVLILWTIIDYCVFDQWFYWLTYLPDIVFLTYYCNWFIITIEDWYCYLFCILFILILLSIYYWLFTIVVVLLFVIQHCRYYSQKMIFDDTIYCVILSILRTSIVRIDCVIFSVDQLMILFVIPIWPMIYW